MKEREARRGKPRRALLGNWLMAAGILLLLTPLALLAYEEIAYRIEMSQAPTPSPVLLSPAGTAYVEPLPAPPPASEEQPGEGTPAEEPSAPTEVVPLRFDHSQGAPTYQIQIPSIGVDYLVGEGIEDQVLAKGPGHYPQTLFPGEEGTAALAGHRTIRGRPGYFHRLNEVKAGDMVWIEYRDRRLGFTVERVFLTSPYDLTVLHPTAHPSLTLTTCDPPGSDEMRLIVQARLTESTRIER